MSVQMADMPFCSGERSKGVQHYIQQLGRVQGACGAAVRKIRCKGSVGGYVTNKGQPLAAGQSHRLDAVAHIAAQLGRFKLLSNDLITDQAQRPPPQQPVSGGRPAGLRNFLSLNKFPLFMQHNAEGGKCRRTVCSGFCRLGRKRPKAGCAAAKRGTKKGRAAEFSTTRP